MRNWIISVLEAARADEFTGQLRFYFRHGRLQHVMRTAMGVGIPEESPRDPLPILDDWIGKGRTGEVEVFILVGTVVDVRASDMLFPPQPTTPKQVKADACPKCWPPVILKRGQDYGNILVCLKCGWQGTELALRNAKLASKASEGG